VSAKHEPQKHEPQLRTLIVTCVGDRLSGDVDAGVVPWWSVTKTAMAAAALMLSERGRLTLDAPLPGRPFTLRQLLRHDAGLRDYTAVPAYLAAAQAGAAPWSEAELLARVEADRLAYPPGGGWTYSNVGYLLARRAIEHAFEADLEAALQALVFAPLGG
jgi:D-alanyl-D-alanine carboxypeptidase